MGCGKGTLEFSVLGRCRYVESMLVLSERCLKAFVVVWKPLLLAKSPCNWSEGVVFGLDSFRKVKKFLIGQKKM